MSFIPGLAEEFSKALNNTVDTVGGALNTAGGAVNDTWNWLTGNSNPEDDLNSSLPISKNPNDSSETGSVDELDPLKAKEDYSKFSLVHLLALFRAEAMHHCENKAKVPYLKVKEAQEKNRDLTQLLKVFTAQSDNQGDFEAQDEKTLELLARAKSLGVEIPDKTKFTKAERDSAIRNIDYSLKVIGDDIRIGFNDAQEALQQRNTFYQELKTCWDKITEVIRKFIQAITPR